MAPDDVVIETVQLVASEATWRRRYSLDPDRPPIDEFYERRYEGAQAVPVDHRLDTEQRDPAGVAAA